MENQNQQALKPIERLKNALASDSVSEQFRNALKEHSDSFVASIIDLYGTDNQLQACEPGLVIKEALKAAVMKLPINKALGFAYVVAYKGVPTFQMGYKGYIQLAMRTGQYRIINADVVYEGEYRTKNKLTGEFDLSGTAKGDTIVGYFAHIEMLNGFSKTLYMSKAKVVEHATKYSKSFNSQYSPWKTNFDEMATKTVIRNLLSHYGFLSVEMANAMDSDVEVDTAADNLQNDLRDHANKESFSFEDAHVVDEENNNNQSSEDIPEAFR